LPSARAGAGPQVPETLARDGRAGSQCAFEQRARLLEKAVDLLNLAVPLLELLLLIWKSALMRW
jgi:hypothetical protein